MSDDCHMLYDIMILTVLFQVIVQSGLLKRRSHRTSGLDNIFKRMP